MLTHGSEARSYASPPGAHRDTGQVTSRNDRPPSRENAAAMPRAPPSLQRSCCQAPTTSPGKNRLVAKDGSTSAPGYRVEVGVFPTVQPANGLPWETGPPEASAGVAVRMSR